MKLQQLLKTFLIFGLFFGVTVFALATETDLRSRDFILDVWKITPWNSTILWEGETAVDGANNALTVIIQKLMVFIWGVALLVMSIGAWFMILHKWDDASLSKWKEIFIAWIIWLSVALFSYLIVSTLRYLIYSI